MKIIDRFNKLLDDNKNTKKNQNQLSLYLKINATTINAWRKRNKDPDSKYIIPICKFFDVDVIWFLTGQESDNINQKHNNLLNKYDKMNDTQKLIINSYIDFIMLNN